MFGNRIYSKVLYLFFICLVAKFFFLISCGACRRPLSLAQGLKPIWMLYW